MCVCVCVCVCVRASSLSVSLWRARTRTASLCVCVCVCVRAHALEHVCCISPYLCISRLILAIQACVCKLGLAVFYLKSWVRT